MIREIRKKYNQSFTPERYEAFVKDLSRPTGKMDFRVCETPLFLSNEFRDRLIEGVNDIVAILQTAEFKKMSENAMPGHLVVPYEDAHPLFLQIDFAVTQKPDGEYFPKLIELQGFPSLYAYQVFLANMYKKNFEIPAELHSYFGGLDEAGYTALVKKAICGAHDPENVILMEITPKLQKTAVDFICTEQMTGVKAVCITDIIKRGKKLSYKREDGVEVPIERVYNRVIFDELFGKKIRFNFSFSDELDISWAGHPNWFYKISKYSLPYIKSEFAPKTWFLNELDAYPDDLENYVLKPLFSFAGSGVEVDVTREKLEAVKPRDNYILQQKIAYHPCIETPDEPAKAEVRMMLLWMEDGPRLVNNLVRTSKGKMIGVDFNKDKTWIGASVALHY